MFKTSSTVIIVLFALNACNKQNDNIEVLARVENSTLTRDEVMNEHPEYGDVEIESRVTQWINTELLYIAGVDAGFHKDLTIVNQVDSYRKKLIGQTYLEMTIQSLVSVSAEEIRGFYTEKKETFKRTRGEALINNFIVDNKMDANIIRTLLEKGVNNKKRDKLFEEHGVSAIRVEEDQLLPAINKAVFGKSKRNYAGPINIGKGFAVIEIIKRLPKGTYRDLDDVYDNIYLMIQKKKAAIKYAAIIDSLKQEYKFELNFGGL